MTLGEQSTDNCSLYIEGNNELSLPSTTRCTSRRRIDEAYLKDLFFISFFSYDFNCIMHLISYFAIHITLNLVMNVLHLPHLYSSFIYSKSVLCAPTAKCL